MPTRSFVPATLDTADFAAIEPLFAALQSRPLALRADLERWLIHWSELGAVLSETGARRYIDMTCHTDDPAAEKAYLHLIEEIQPRCKPRWQKLEEKFLATPARRELPPERYFVFDRNTENDAALFRQENVPLLTAEAKLDQQYNKTAGGMTCFFDGSERTVPQMGRYLEETDRPRRLAAWESLASVRYQHRAAFDELLDRQIALRDQMARNAGHPTYVEYAFRMYHRFDYTPADCAAFHAAVRETCVPVVRAMLARRQARLGLEKLRPWDTAVDVLGRPPLRPFETVEQLVAGVRRVLKRVRRRPRGTVRHDAPRQTPRPGEPQRQGPRGLSMHAG